MNRKRDRGFGPAPLSSSEILSYFTLHRIDYDAIELYLLDVLDNIAMEHFAEQQKKEQTKNKNKP